MASLFIEYITNKFIVYGTYCHYITVLELRYVIFEKIRFKITIVSSETEFLFSYRFNVRVYGAHEV
jgi:hypothetical protein